jgi:hypothetical protein
VNSEIPARLQQLQIQVMVDAAAFCVLAREECIVVAPREPNGEFGSLGSTGLMTENGLAYLVWRDGSPWLVTHGAREVPATPEQVEKIQRFSGDLKTAIG